MSGRDTPEGQRREPGTQGHSTSAEEDERISAGLEAALAELTQVARESLSDQVLGEGEREEEGSPNPLYGVNIQRGAVFDELRDIDESLFEPRAEMATATPEAIDNEIERMQAQLRNTRGERHANTFGGNPRRNWRTTFGDGTRLYPPAGSDITGVQRTLFADIPAAVGENAEVGATAGQAQNGDQEAQRNLQEMVSREVDRKLEALLPPPLPPGNERNIPQDEGNRERMRAYLDIGLALKSIPNFDGSDPGELDGFLQSCESVWGMIQPLERPILLTLVRSGKIRGRATRELRHKDISTLKDLKKEMEALYAQRKSLTALQFEFSQLRQGAKEAVSTYATRVEKLAVEMVEKLCEGVEPHGMRYIEYATRRSAQSAFENGLNKEVQMIVRSRNYGSLHDSVVGALEVEKMVGSLGNGGCSDPKQSRTSLASGEVSPKKCFSCGDAGHIARECPRKSGRHSLPAPGPSCEVNQVKATCNYCGKSGHFWKQCPLRTRHLAERKLQIGKQQEERQVPSTEGVRNTVGAFLKEAETAVGGQVREVYVVNATATEDSANDFRIKSPTSEEGFLTLKADTGAQVSIISARAIHKETTAAESAITVTGLDGRPIRATCAAEIQLETPTAVITHWFHVMPKEVDLGVHGFLGMDFIRKHEVDILGGREIEIYGHRMPLINGRQGVQSQNNAFAATCSVTTTRVRKVGIDNGMTLESGVTTSRQGNYAVCLVDAKVNGDKHASQEENTENAENRVMRSNHIYISEGEASRDSGMTLPDEGVRPNSARTAAARDFPTPCDTGGARTFLGQLSHYRKFLSDLAGMAETPDLGANVKRWKTRRSEYEYDEEYKAGKRNASTDYSDDGDDNCHDDGNASEEEIPR